MPDAQIIPLFSPRRRKGETPSEDLPALPTVTDSAVPAPRMGVPLEEVLHWFVRGEVDDRGSEEV